MSIRNLLIIVLIIVLLGLFYFNKGKNREYELKGKVTMKNDCTKNNVDLPKKIRIKAKLHYQRSTVNPSSFNKGDIATAVVNAKTKDATYSLKETTSEIAKEWKIEAIVRNDGSEICKPIACKSPKVCRNMATLVRNRFTVPIPSGQTIVTRDYRFDCGCVE